jgi:hypothetical protein
MPTWIKSRKRYGWTLTFALIGVAMLTLLIPDGIVRWVVIATLVVSYLIALARLPTSGP